MNKFFLVHFNRLDCELARYPVVQEDNGSPLMLATVAQNVELREGLSVMAAGDRLELVEQDPTDFLALARDAYQHAERNYGKKGARYDVIVECMSKAEIAAELEAGGIRDYAAAQAWADRRAELHHEQELNQAWDGPESCIGSALYDPARDPAAG